LKRAGGCGCQDQDGESEVLYQAAAPAQGTVKAGIPSLPSTHDRRSGARHEDRPRVQRHLAPSTVSLRPRQVAEGRLVILHRCTLSGQAARGGCVDPPGAGVGTGGPRPTVGKPPGRGCPVHTGRGKVAGPGPSSPQAE
jgi:hypothetical protein